jgi:hypothetical protein
MWKVITKFYGDGCIEYNPPEYTEDYECSIDNLWSHIPFPQFAYYCKYTATFATLEDAKRSIIEIAEANHDDITEYFKRL